MAKRCLARLGTFFSVAVALTPATDAFAQSKSALTRDRYTLSCSAGGVGFTIYGGAAKDADVVVAVHEGSGRIPARDLLHPFALKRVENNLFSSHRGTLNIRSRKLTVNGYGTFDCEPGPIYRAVLRQNQQPERNPSVRTAATTPGELRLPGLSYGGKVRGAPGMDGTQIGSLPEGAEVTIVANKGNRMNGFDWFQIEWGAQKRIGYQWGGILCAPGRDVPGMYRCQ